MHKNKNLTKRTAASLAAVLALSSAAAVTASASGVKAAPQAIEEGSETARTAFSIPSGAYYMNVKINGRDVLPGKVFNLGGVTYVPMFEFADWLGVFTKSFDQKSRTAYISGKNLEVCAIEGKLYISANGRYFYTDGEIINWGGKIYVPIRPLVKALNCHISYNTTENKFIVGSGDSSRLLGGDKVYNKDDVYWLARIISAEARGEGLRGMMAVGNVILNRMRCPQFPNTIYNVIFDTKYGIQFTPVANGTIYNSPTAESIIAAKICLEGYSLSSEILYFFNPKIAHSNWISNNREYAFTVNNHAFYK